MSDLAALLRLNMMGDWLKLKSFNSRQLLEEIQPFSNSWQTYNPRKKNNRFGLSITSLDGALSGVPDLDSLLEYNKENGTQLNNQSFKTYTDVYTRSLELQEILAPFKPWVGRCHFIRLDSGGFFPNHYDNEKLNYDYEEIRLIGLVNQTHMHSFKFIYDRQLLTFLSDGDLYYFNANKEHSVFSMQDGVIFLVVTLRFDHHLFAKMIEEFQIK